MKSELLPRRYFAAANTGCGFFNRFDNILDSSRFGYTFILKGGPGTGKNTLMKKVGAHFLHKGFAIEYFHCSSDPDSVDGVRLTHQNIAVVDGTAPHACDAALPKIDGEIINLSVFIRSAVRESQAKIRRHVAEKTLCFQRVTHMLSDANALLSKLAEQQKPPSQVTSECNAALKQIPGLENTIGGDGKKPVVRRLFLSAIGGDGVLDFIEKNNFLHIVELPYATSDVLLALSEDLCARGISQICFLDLLDPTKIDRLYLEDLDVLIERNVPACAACTELLSRAAAALEQAKAEHKAVEHCYRPYVDFDAIGRTAEKLIQKMEVMPRCPAPQTSSPHKL